MLNLPIDIDAIYLVYESDMGWQFVIVVSEARIDPDRVNAAITCHRLQSQPRV
ncbi:hypothetical protein D9M73_279000 [compost metagenome]